LTFLVALLLLPTLVFAASHKVVVGTAQVKADNLVTVPLNVANQDGFMAADIPLTFSEGVTLKEVDFAGTRVEYFDLKVANIDNEQNRVIIGLVTQMSPEHRPDLTNGEGPVANLVFQIDDPTVKEIRLEPTVIEEPRHALTFIYHELGANGPVGQTRVDPEFEGVSFSLTNSSLPTEFALSQNYPNPFNPTTDISFSLPQATHVTLDIFNVLGQKVNTLVDSDMPAGNHTVTWNGDNASGSSVSSGVYFYRISAGKDVETKKMMMLK
jgi:hypothetical protein